MLKHKRMNAPKKDDLKDVAKEETMGMPVKGKEAKKNQEMDEAVDKKDSDVKKISKADGRGGEKVDGEEEQKARRAEAKEVGEEASRRIQGLEPPQDDLEEELKEEKQGTSDMQDKEVSTNKLDKDEVPEDQKTESLKKVSTDKKDSLEKISADKKDSDVEKVLTDEKDSTLEKVLDELEPSKDEKCCGFKGIEPVGGRYVQI